MATTPFITVNTGQVKAYVDAVNAKMDEVTEVIIAATQKAIVEMCEQMLAKAQAKIHSMSGDLEASGTVLPVEMVGQEIIGRWGFNKEYARIRDQGGDIEPVRARMLATPLDAIMTATGPRFASPKEEQNLELVPILNYLFLADKITGEFHWILVPHVHQDGSQFVSGTVQEEAQNVPAHVAELVTAALGGQGR